ncbi:MAG: hypothetical protein C0483_14160 [Pirellula sp.]|nr:hypothetical protein [Pirellula sp.]
MRSLLRTSAIAFPFMLAVVALSWWWTTPLTTSAGLELGAAINLTSHASEATPPDLRLSLRPPLGWKVEEHEHPRADMVLTILPPDGLVSRTSISVVISREPSLLAAPKPIIPPGATVHAKRETMLGGQPAAFVEALSIAPNKSYSRTMSWQATIDGRHFAFAGTVAGTPAESADVDRRFQKYRETFEAVAASVRVEPKKLAE